MLQNHICDNVKMSFLVIDNREKLKKHLQQWHIEIPKQRVHQKYPTKGNKHAHRESLQTVFINIFAKELPAWWVVIYGFALSYVDVEEWK